MNGEPFTIEITKRVVFRDMHGTVTRVYEVGDRIEATAESQMYYVHSYGGIWKDEAKRVIEWPQEVKVDPIEEPDDDGA